MIDRDYVVRVFESAGHAVAAFDDGLRARYWNPAMEALTDVAEERAIGSNAYELFPRLTEATSEDCFRAALEGVPTLGDPPFRGAADGARAQGVQWHTLP
jgi:PAS domain S-box-containing protein